MLCQLVGEGGKQGAKTRPKAVQWNHHLHCMELMEGEEQEDLQQRPENGTAGGLLDKRGYNATSQAVSFDR